MEPRFQYTTTTDGVSIAFCTLGSGTPLIALPSDPWSHIQLEWETPAWRAWHQRLAQHRMLVLYDSRGTGLSDRDATGFTLDSQMLDLNAVIDGLRLRGLTLLGAGSAGPTAIAYAALHPDRVERLILWCSYARASDYLDSAPIQALLALMAKDWSLFTETAIHARVSPPAEGTSSRTVDLLQESLTPQIMETYFSQTRHVDVTSLLPQVRTPTLVLHRLQAHIGPSVETARRLASLIPGARLSLLEGTSVAPYLGDTEAVLRAMEEFLGEGGPPRRPSGERPQGVGAEPLSKRELEVLQLMAAGMSNQEIAQELFIALGTVKTHTNHIYGKLDVSSRTRALARAKELDLL